MSDYESNVYYRPEKNGLKVVGSIEYSSGCYEFDTRVVWFHEKTGRLLTARDSGCSCPTPFEDYDGVDSLEDITIEYDSFLVSEWKNEPDYRQSNVQLSEVRGLVAKCDAALEEAY